MDPVELAKRRVGTALHGKWTLDRLIDSGGMACVFAATHRNGNRVAIKLLHPGVARNDDARNRFLNEGYAANRVGHPGAVKVLDDDVTADGAVFLVMELLTGETLADRIERAPIPAELALFIGDQVLDVLAAAHEKNIIHRDIKPANVFLTEEGTVKLLDFGFARVREGGETLTQTRDGIVIGTASFMAPEQAMARREQVGARTDLWAVGATLFTSLSGQTVHQGKTMVDRLLAAADKPARPLASVVPTIASEVADVVDRALQFKIEDRWPDARSMQNAVRNAYEDLTGMELPDPGRTSVLPVVPSVARPPSPPAAPAANLDDEIDIELSVAFELQPRGDTDKPATLEISEDDIDDASLISASMIQEVPTPED